MLKKILPLLIISSCSLFQASEVQSKKEAYKDYLVKQITPKWFTVHAPSALTDRQGQPLPHLFFDADPNMNLKSSTVDFVILTPSGSNYTRGISLLSGQTYSDKSLCPTKDLWDEIKRAADVPNFTMGFVPRLFNQINEPQQIIVYGRDRYYQNAPQNASYKVKILGGVIYQTCPDSICTNPNEWLSSLLLIAVDPKDESLGKSKTLGDLLKKVDWDYSKVFLESSLGVRVIGERSYAANKLSSLINVNQVNKLIKSHSLYWSQDKLKSIKKNCLSLYSDITKASNKGTKFYDYMRTDYKKFSEEINTCLRYVYPKSFNTSSREFIFFTHFQAYQYLHQLGYFYSCAQGGWQSNPMLDDGKRAVNSSTYQKDCLNSELDRAFKTSIQYLSNLINKLKPSYRFLTYDNWSSDPTYNKHYSWIPFDGRVSSCKNKALNKYPIQMSPSYPKDLRWKSLIPKEKEKSLLIR